MSMAAHCEKRIKAPRWSTFCVSLWHSDASRAILRNSSFKYGKMIFQNRQRLSFCHIFFLLVDWIPGDIESISHIATTRLSRCSITSRFEWFVNGLSSFELEKKKEGNCCKRLEPRSMICRWYASTCGVKFSHRRNESFGTFSAVCALQ